MVRYASLFSQLIAIPTHGDFVLRHSFYKIK